MVAGNKKEFRPHSDPTSTPAEQRFLHRLAGLYALLWLALAINPFNRFDWFLENLLVFVAVAAIALTYRRFALSRPAYLLIAGFLALHAVGAHYTYSENPLGAGVQTLLQLERNHYDRAVHFCYGLLLVYPFFDLYRRHVRPSHGAWCYLFAIMTVLATSGLYEIIEWTAALLLEPDDALAFLGTQGDVFDAQKDATLAFVGGFIALTLVGAFRRRH